MPQLIYSEDRVVMGFSSCECMSQLVGMWEKHAVCCMLQSSGCVLKSGIKRQVPWSKML